MKIALIKNKNRNSSISIGASVVLNELRINDIPTDIISWDEAGKYDIVMISVTATNDMWDLLYNMIKYDFKNRKFKVLIGGFGAQNLLIYKEYIDYAFLGRAEGAVVNIVKEIYKGEVKEYSFLYDYNTPKPKELRQVDELYPYPVKYGKSNIEWKEKFIGCPFHCKFCHYSWNRKLVSDHNGYYNNGLSLGSPEIMLKDVRKVEQKLGRFTTALDGYSERLRFKWGKKIKWDLVEEGLDNILSFKGNTFIKLYNIHNLPTETEADREEFFNFFKEYAECTEKADGIVNIEVLNTAFRPSIRTPMELMETKLFPEARYENTQIAVGKGVIVKFSKYNQDAYTHLLDLISIRYRERDKNLTEYILLDKNFNKLNNKEKLNNLMSKYDLSYFIKELNKPIKCY